MTQILIFVKFKFPTFIKITKRLPRPHLWDNTGYVVVLKRLPVLNQKYAAQGQANKKKFQLKISKEVIKNTYRSAKQSFITSEFQFHAN